MTNLVIHEVKAAQTGSPEESPGCDDTWLNIQWTIKFTL